MESEPREKIPSAGWFCEGIKPVMLHHAVSLAQYLLSYSGPHTAYRSCAVSLINISPMFTLLNLSVLVLSDTVLYATAQSFMGNNALVTVLRQEIDRFNHLLSAIHSTLASLTLAIKGEVIMSDALEEAYNALLRQEIPGQWKVSLELTGDIGRYYTSPWICGILQKEVGDEKEKWKKRRTNETNNVTKNCS